MRSQLEQAWLVHGWLFYSCLLPHSHRHYLLGSSNDACLLWSSHDILDLYEVVWIPVSEISYNTTYHPSKPEWDLRSKSECGYRASSDVYVCCSAPCVQPFGTMHTGKWSICNLLTMVNSCHRCLDSQVNCSLSGIQSFFMHPGAVRLPKKDLFLFS